VAGPGDYLQYLSALAGAALGAWLSGAGFGHSWAALGAGAVIGLFLLGPLVLHGALGAAGVLLSLGSRSAATKIHPVRAHRLAAGLIVCIALAGVAGVLSFWMSI